MSKTANELVAASVGVFSANLSHLESGFTQEDKWELERQILVAQNLLSTVKAVYQDWLVGMQKGQQAFRREDQEGYNRLIESLLDIFTNLEARVQAMEKAMDVHVAHSQVVYNCILETQSLQKQKWVPVAPVSSMFEEIEIGGENAKFLDKYLPTK